MNLAPKNTLRIATYNIRKCVGLDWKRRPDRVVCVLSELRADVVLLQEADRRFGSRRGTLPAEALYAETGLRLKRLNESSPSHGHCGNVLLVAESITVHALEALRLPSLEPRGALIAEVSKNGPRIRIAGAHLGLRAADRRRQTMRLVEEFAAHADSASEILLGDFNEWRVAGGSLSPLKARFQCVEAGASFHASSPVAPLDRIFLGSGLELLRAGVHRSAISRKASDHLPVWAEVRLA